MLKRILPHHTHLAGDGATVHRSSAARAPLVHMPLRSAPMPRPPPPQERHGVLRVPLRGVDKADAGDMSDLGLGNGGDSSAPPGDASSAGSLRCSSTPP